MTLDCDTLVIPDADQVVVGYLAAPESGAAQTLSLRVIGTPDLAAR